MINYGYAPSTSIYCTIKAEKDLLLSLARMAAAPSICCASAAQHHIYEGIAYRRIQMFGFAVLLMLQIFIKFIRA
jgi:hypothetical protein